MKVLKIIAKVVLSIAAVVFLGGSNFSSDPGGAIIFFAACYGLVTWYMFSFSNSDGIFVGDGLISMAFAVILNLGLPILILTVPMFILEAILPGQIGTIIYGIILSVACLYCILGDLIHIVRLFNPTFLGSFGDIFDLES